MKVNTLQTIQCNKNAFDNHENMELLSINILKPVIYSYEISLDTPRELSVIPEQDLVEVFI